ncbi:MAG: DNA methyltransferase [Candidatus Zixiibacteriota bacterium]
MNRELNLHSESVREAIDSRIKLEGLKPKPVKPLEAPVLAQGHTASYKMHRYYARRPHNVFSKLVENYSNPGDVILDPFCGGGVTVVEGLKLRRRVVGIDLNPLATWVTQVEVEPVDLDVFEELFRKWLRQVAPKIRQLFKAECPKCRKEGIAEWYEWSNVVLCPWCKKDVVLAQAKKKGPGRFVCQNRKCRAVIEPSKSELKPDAMIAAVVRCKQCEKILRRDVTQDDLARYGKIARREKSVIKRERLRIPTEPFPDMDRARDDNVFGKGMKYFKDFMTPRHRIACGRMKKYLPPEGKRPNEVNALRHLFSSILRYTNKFVFQSASWQSGKPIEWAGHNYWLPFHYLELNPVPYLERRFKAFKAGKTEQARQIGNFFRAPATREPWKELQNGATCWILTQSSHKINLPDQSVDAVITDPPFGGNVQYGELSDFYLVWVKKFLELDGPSEKSTEAIETRNTGFQGAKDREFYEEMLYKVFRECRRVVKPDGWMVLTFHNRDIGVWMSLHRAALRAGFKLPSQQECSNRGMIYQPPVQNYTQTIHQRAAGSMLGDFILSFKPVQAPVALESIKPSLSTEEEGDIQSIAEEIIKYHGGADETTLMTGFIPFLHERSLLHRIAKYDLKMLLESGPFVYAPREKKWYLREMVEDTARVADFIPAEVMVQEMVYSYLSEHKRATIDQLLIQIYTTLVNSHRPQMSTIEKVLSRYCSRRKVKGGKREVFVWKPSAKTPDQIKRELARQTAFDFGAPIDLKHDAIIEFLAQGCTKKGFDVHVGRTEQRKSGKLSSLSAKLTGMELGLPDKAFRLIREIDLLILKNSTILAAVEVATSIGTFNKAVNDRFRNLLAVAPNLRINLNVVVRSEDFEKARSELFTLANVKSGLAKKVKLLAVSDISRKDMLRTILRRD